MTDSNINNNNINNSNNNINNNNNNNNNTSLTTNGVNANAALRLKMPEDEKYPAAENNNTKVTSSIGVPSNGVTQSKKKKRRDKSDLGDDFVPPDGGWGWLVAVASGVNILVTFALAQQFGIIFRDRMQNIGITSSELTSIINIQIAVSAFTGLLNGPLFRRYSYRQVALVGSALTFIGLFLIIFANSFAFYVVGFSVIYGFGRGLTVSASSLAVNTYFKQKRRTATAYQFGVAGLGPIVCPYLATYLIKSLGVQGTVAIFAALSLHTIACSLIYQPVKWHVVKRDRDAEALKTNAHDAADAGDYDDDHIIDQIVEPDTPVLPRANDGWFGSRTSINSSSSNAIRNRVGTWGSSGQQQQQHVELKRLNSRDSGTGRKIRSFSTSHSIKEENHDEHEQEQEENESKQSPLLPEHIRTLPTIMAPLAMAEEHLDEEELERERRKKLSFLQKIVIFFDLDLLRDITYVNLSVGITLINFVEINFAILTPFILHDFGYDMNQIALAMSSLGFCDLVIRFLIPLITAKMNFSNKTFFIIGIIGMCFGRMLLSVTNNFYTMVGIFLWLGLNKAFRTVFWSLIIPGYVPLKRLPAAAGLQLLMSGTFSMVFGPLIGIVRDSTNYAFTLNFLNALCIIAIVLWLLEDFIRYRQRKSKPVAADELKS